MRAIGAVAAEAQVVGFQEVTDDTFALLSRDLARRGFGCLARQRTACPYYCCLAVKQDALGPLVGVETVDFRGSRMGRGLLCGRAHWRGVGDVLLGVAHLESFVGQEKGDSTSLQRGCS